MATKMGVAVTTIQGWKQRDSIPSGRRDELIEAAQEHGVDLSDLLGSAKADMSASSVKKDEVLAPVQEKTVDLSARKASTTQSRQSSGRDFSDDVISRAELQMESPKTTLIAAGIIIIAAAIIGIVFAVAPKVHKLTDQEQRIAELEQEVEQMKAMKRTVSDASQSSLKIPAEYADKITNLQAKVGELADQANGYRSTMQSIQNDLQNGNMQQRLAQVEQHINGLVAQAKDTGFQDMITRIQLMQQSPEGSNELGQVVGNLVNALQLPEGAGDDNIVAAFEQLKKTDPQIAATFKDVAPEDMKAAAMLIGMSQLRSSLARNNDSFDQDLALLKQTLAKEDPELSDAIDRLAPKAKSGVLTPEGLSTEFRSLAGDIVSSSLAGENVSIEDKALARLGSLVKVEKDGERISGTQTQIKVAQAQKLLDQGDVAGAVAILQEVQGPAAAKTQPFIDQAQATLMAQKVQQMLGQNLVAKLQGQMSSFGARGKSGMNGGYMAPTGGVSGGMNSMMNNFKSIVPEAK